MSGTVPKALLVVPANSSTMQPELVAMCPELAPLPVARVERGTSLLSLETLPQYTTNTLKAVEPFVNDGVDYILYGCTAAGFLAGPEKNAEIVERLTAMTGAQVVSTADAMVSVMHDANVARTAVVSPYMDEVNDRLSAYLRKSGIEVERLNSFRCGTVERLMAVNEDQVYEKVNETVTPQTEAMFIACAQLPTLGIIPRLRRELNLPVWSSILSTAISYAVTAARNGWQSPLLSNRSLIDAARWPPEGLSSLYR
ncbi:maleate cis-trans isomerase family protein (plasmid) [Mesorhizobium sp. ORM8.1]